MKHTYDDPINGRRKFLSSVTGLVGTSLVMGYLQQVLQQVYGRLTRYSR